MPRGTYEGCESSLEAFLEWSGVDVKVGILALPTIKKKLKSKVIN